MTNAPLPVTRPLLRHFGGKFQLRHWIGDHINSIPHDFYAEPFAGAASILLSKSPAPKGEIINDLNQEVINLFRVMQSAEQSIDLMRRLDWTPYAKAEFDLSFEPSQDPIEQARRLVIASFMGIEVSGIAGRGTGFRMGNVDLNRFDKAGVRTFRNCAKDWAGWKDALPAIRDRLRHVMIYERDALEFIDLMDTAQCLLYIDPPYDHNKRSETRYKVEFTNHPGLVSRLLTCKSKVVLSGYRCPDYDRLTDAGWRLIEKDYRANMSATRRTECLWISPNAQSPALPI